MYRFHKQYTRLIQVFNNYRDRNNTRNCETRVFSTRHTNFNASRRVVDRAQFAIPIIFVAASYYGA